MKMFVAASAAVTLCAFALSGPSANAAATAEGMTAGVPATAGVQLAHGIHADCQAGPRRGWVHRHGLLIIGSGLRC